MLLIEVSRLEMSFRDHTHVNAQARIYWCVSASFVNSPDLKVRNSVSNKGKNVRFESVVIEQYFDSNPMPHQ